MANSSSLEFWFHLGSPYSYLSRMCSARLAAEAGGRMSWPPPLHYFHCAILPHRAILLGANKPQLAAFCKALMQWKFAENRDNDPLLAVFLMALGFPAAAIIARTQSQVHKQLLRDQTQVAPQHCLFGATTTFVADEMFRGNERLDNDRALAGTPCSPDN